MGGMTMTDRSSPGRHTIRKESPMHHPSRIALTLAAAALASAAHAAGPALDTSSIEAVTGLKGTYNKTENVFKVSKPRDDVKLSVDRWALPPFMGITSWAAFTPMGDSTMLMGDTVLFEDEVNVAMSAALDAGLAVTALHNHFFFDQPKVYFMHLGGEGTVEQMAAGVRAALAKQKDIRAAQPQPAKVFGTGFAPAKNAITGAAIDAALGTKGQANNGMFKIVIGRTTK